MHPPHAPKALIEVPLLPTCAPSLLTDEQVDALQELQLPGAPLDATLPRTFDCTSQLGGCIGGGVLAGVAHARHVALVSDSSKPVHEQVVRAPCEPVTYLLHLHRQQRDVKVELTVRGPVLVTLHVSGALCKHWSHLVSRRAPDVKPFVQDKVKDVQATVVAALVGWTEDECWLVYPAWSLAASMHCDGAMPCIKVKMEDMVTLCPWAVGMLPELPRPASAAHPPLMHVRRVPLDLGPAKSNKPQKPSKVVKAKVKLGHGDNKTRDSRRPFTQLKQKVSAGDIASITFMGITCALVAVVLCMLLSRWLQRSKRVKGEKTNGSTKVNV